MMTCYTLYNSSNGTLWWFYGGSNNPSQFIKQYLYGSGSNLLVADSTNVNVDPNTVASFSPGFNPLQFRASGQQNYLYYYLDSSVVNATLKDISAYMCPTQVILIRPLLMDCLTEPDVVQPVIAQQLQSVITALIASMGYGNTTILPTFTLNITRDNSTTAPCNQVIPQTPAPAFAIVIFDDPSGVLSQNVPVHGFDLAFLVKDHPTVFKTIRIAPTVNISATQNDPNNPSFIVLDYVTPLFGTCCVTVPPPASPPPLDNVSIPDTWGGLPTYGWVIIFFVVAVLVLLCLIATFYFVGTKEHRRF